MEREGPASEAQWEGRGCKAPEGVSGDLSLPAARGGGDDRKKGELTLSLKQKVE